MRCGAVWCGAARRGVAWRGVAQVERRESASSLLLLFWERLVGGVERGVTIMGGKRQVRSGAQRVGKSGFPRGWQGERSRVKSSLVDSRRHSGEPATVLVCAWCCEDACGEGVGASSVYREWVGCFVRPWGGEGRFVRRTSPFARVTHLLAAGISRFSAGGSTVRVIGNGISIHFVTLLLAVTRIYALTFYLAFCKLYRYRKTNVFSNIVSKIISMSRVLTKEYDCTFLFGYRLREK